MDTLQDKTTDTACAWKVISVYDRDPVVGPQGQRLTATITKDICGSSQLAAGLVYMPPGVSAKAHVHNKYEMVVFVLEGFAVSLIGDDLEPAVQGPGEFLFIPAGVPHLAVNLSMDRPVVGIEVRADPAFNDDVELLPHLEEKAAAIIEQVRAKHAAGELPKGWQSRDRVFQYKVPEDAK